MATVENFDQLLTQYKQATDDYIAALREEESLANADHSMIEMEKWDAADLRVKDTAKVAAKARDVYRDALREKNYNF